MQKENVYLKFLAIQEQIAKSGGMMVRITQKLDVVESRCHGTSSFFGILIPMPVISQSRFSTTVGCFLICIY